MRIVHIVIGLDVGGAELMLMRLIHAHVRDPRYHHTVISLTRIGKVGEQLQALGVEVEALDMHSPLDIPRVLWQLMRRIRTSRASIVQTWMYHADLLGGLAARLAGNRHVIWGIRTTEVRISGSRATAAVRQACVWLSPWIPHTIVCAADSSRRAHEALGYNASRMVVVHNGFDMSRLVSSPEQRAALRAQAGFGANTVVIGNVGRFNPAKDQENFVRAAGLLARQHAHVRFLMVGRNLTTDNAELMHWITRTGYANRFVLLGERVDVPVCLSGMDIFCLSSRTEGFPNVVGEAMAMGLSCVVTDVGDASALVADTGIVVPKEDSAALAEGIASLLELPSDARQRIGQQAKARLQAEFTIARARENFEAVYTRVTRTGKY